MTKEEIIELTERITAGIASDEEILLYNRLFNSFRLSVTEKDGPPDENKEVRQAQIKEAVDSRLAKAKQAVRMPFIRYAAAAAVTVLLGTASYFLFFYKRPAGEVAAGPSSVPMRAEIAPGKDGAILTLANGKTIVLEEAGNGQITAQAVKESNTLSYKNAPAAVVEYNTVSTPNGRQFSLLLADGSRVWLNAASSLRFPTAFAGNERSVEMTGEAYFEVAHNATVPFRVKAAGTDVQVVGTHFNVMAYGDEALQKTTLLEGKVRVKTAGGIALLLPGQQAQAAADGTVSIDKEADTEEAVAWKAGLFHFKNADVGTVMRTLARWYNVEVVYKGEIPDKRLTGKFYRNASISQVLEILDHLGIHSTVAPAGSGPQRIIITQ